METVRDPLSAQSVTMTSAKDFAELYERNYRAVYCAALRVTGNPADAEDVLQTVFLRVLNLGERSGFTVMSEAYFRRAAINAAVDLLRRRISRAEIRLHEAAPQAWRENTEMLKQTLRRAIAALDENDAVLFLLRYVEGLSNEELAQMFGQEKNNIAVRLYRIRQTLQAEMER